MLELSGFSLHFTSVALVMHEMFPTGKLVNIHKMQKMGCRIIWNPLGINGTDAV